MPDKSAAFNTSRLEALELDILMDVAEATAIAAEQREESRGGQTGLYRYLTKQTREEYTSFDCMSSLAYNPLTEVVTAPSRKVSYVPATTLSSRSW